MALEDAAADIGPPIAGKVFSRATAITSQRYQIPASWRGQFIAIAAKGFELQLVLGPSTVAAAMDTDSSLASEALTPVATTSYPVPADQERQFRVPTIDENDTLTHFAVIAAGVGRWFGYRAQNRGT